MKSIIAAAVALTWTTSAMAQETPMQRAHHALVYDAHLERVLLIGGSTPLDGGNRYEFFDDVWAYDGVSWKRLHSSGVRRSGERVAYDSKTRTVYSFGGFDGSEPVNDLRRFDGNAWHSLPPLAGHPVAEGGAVYDARRDVLVVFGGWAGQQKTHGDTWEFDGTSWKRIDVAGPPPRQAFSMIYDAARNRTVVFGGFGSDPRTPLGDTWEYDGKEWKQVATDGPSPRHSAGYAFDSKRGRMILFGGYTPAGHTGDTWSWDGRAWRQLSTEGPPARGMGQLAYDAKRDRVVLFGGRAGFPNGDRKDTWEWDGSRWVQIQ